MSKDNRTSTGTYPSEMRNQLWPLCCGAQIISGLKDVHNLTVKEITAQLTDIADNYIADHQVFAGETMKPVVCFLTLNSGQMESPKIIEAVTAAGFLQFAKGTGRDSNQGFFVRNKGGNFKLLADSKVPTTAGAKVQTVAA